MTGASVRFFVALLVLTINCSRLDARSMAEEPNQDLIVHLYVSNNIPEVTVESSIRRAAIILATAHVATVWLKSTSYSGRGFPEQLTKAIAGTRSRELGLTISQNISAHFHPEALGVAFLDSRESSNALVFYGRIVSLAQTTGSAVDVVLGCAMAHELGHVLLRSAQHSGSGIMKSPWNQSDIQHAAALLSTFGRPEAKAIRESLSLENRRENTKQ